MLAESGGGTFDFLGSLTRIVRAKIGLWGERRERGWDGECDRRGGERECHGEEEERQLKEVGENTFFLERYRGWWYWRKAGDI